MIDYANGFCTSQLNFLWNSQGDMDFDYSSNALQRKFGAITNVKSLGNGEFISNSLYIPMGEYTAHNYMNFGNFLWAANGYSIGFNYATLQVGAHVNSLLSPRNGYPLQRDSADDQLSIRKGIFYATKHNLRKLRYTR